MKVRTALVTLTAVAALAGCSSSSGTASATAPATGFDATASSAACMDHQHHRPTAADTTGGDTVRSLTMLRYYTTHGSQPFCDGKPATVTDLAWMRDYVAQGADAAHVARWLRS